MCRVDNLPASFVFVAGGAAAATHQARLALSPPVLVAALCTMLITATSMVSNDYFDYRTGTDVVDEGNVLARHDLSLAQAKRFVSRCYSALLLLICLAPLASVRLLLTAGAISTFLYTKYLKPVTWIKNASVAFICALAPAVGGISACGSLQAALFSPGSRCGGLTLAMFCGIMHREILMDVVDAPADAASGVVTAPVKHGAAFASMAAVLLSGAMTAVCVSMGRRPWGRWVGLAGGLRMTANAWRAMQATKETKKPGLTRNFDFAIEESKLTFPLVLASFL